jgi:hypothetical protein
MMRGLIPPDLIDMIDMIDEVRREIGYRKHVYTRLVREKRMNRGLADRRIDVMEAVLATLEQIRETERKGKE